MGKKRSAHEFDDAFLYFAQTFKNQINAHQTVIESPMHAIDIPTLAYVVQTTSFGKYKLLINKGRNGALSAYVYTNERVCSYESLKLWALLSNDGSKFMSVLDKALKAAIISKRYIAAIGIFYLFFLELRDKTADSGNYSDFHTFVEGFISNVLNHRLDAFDGRISSELKDEFIRHYAKLLYVCPRPSDKEETMEQSKSTKEVKGITAIRTEVMPTRLPKTLLNTDHILNENDCNPLQVDLKSEHRVKSTMVVVLKDVINLGDQYLYWSSDGVDNKRTLVTVVTPTGEEYSKLTMPNGDLDETNTIIMYLNSLVKKGFPVFVFMVLFDKKYGYKPATLERYYAACKFYSDTRIVEPQIQNDQDLLLKLTDAYLKSGRDHLRHNSIWIKETVAKMARPKECPCGETPITSFNDKEKERKMTHIDIIRELESTGMTKACVRAPDFKYENDNCFVRLESFESSALFLAQNTGLSTNRRQCVYPIEMPLFNTRTVRVLFHSNETVPEITVIFHSKDNQTDDEVLTSLFYLNAISNKRGYVIPYWDIARRFFYEEPVLGTEMSLTAIRYAVEFEKLIAKKLVCPSEVGGFFFDFVKNKCKNNQAEQRRFEASGSSEDDKLADLVATTRERLAKDSKESYHAIRTAINNFMKASHDFRQSACEHKRPVDQNVRSLGNYLLSEVVDKDNEHGYTLRKPRLTSSDKPILRPGEQLVKVSINNDTGQLIVDRLY